jgi:hypothetical protein
VICDEELLPAAEVYQGVYATGNPGWGSPALTCSPLGHYALLLSRVLREALIHGDNECEFLAVILGRAFVWFSGVILDISNLVGGYTRVEFAINTPQCTARCDYHYGQFIFSWSCDMGNPGGFGGRAESYFSRFWSATEKATRQTDMELD